MKIIKIGAVWCSGCLVMKPRWVEIEKEYPQLDTQYFDFDTDKEAISRYKVEQGKLPVFVFLDKNGKEITRLSGEVEKEKLLELIGKYKDL